MASRKLSVVHDGQAIIRQAIKLCPNAGVTVCEWDHVFTVADGQGIVGIPVLDILVVVNGIQI